MTGPRERFIGSPAPVSRTRNTATSDEERLELPSNAQIVSGSPEVTQTSVARTMSWTYPSDNNARSCFAGRIEEVPNGTISPPRCCHGAETSATLSHNPHRFRSPGRRLGARCDGPSVPSLRTLLISRSRTRALPHPVQQVRSTDDHAGPVALKIPCALVVRWSECRVMGEELLELPMMNADPTGQATVQQ